MSDAAIARKLNLVRSTVCEHRTRSLELLKTQWRNMDMKTTDKNEKSRNVLPFAVVQKATEGDIVSINKVLKHYEGYISCLSVRKCMINMEMSIIV